MAPTKRILRLLLAGAVGITTVAATAPAQAAAPGTKRLTVTIADYGANPAAAGWGRLTSTPAGIDCPGDCEEAFPHGATVTLTLALKRGYASAPWDVRGNDAGPGCDGGLACTLTIGPGDAAEVVAWLRPEATLHASAVGAGALRITPAEEATAPCSAGRSEGCSPRYPTGTRVTATAVPDATVPGARFVRWSDYRCRPDRRTCTLTMGGEQYLNAIFEPVFLTVHGGTFGPVSVSPPGVVCAFAPDPVTGAQTPCRIPYELGDLATIARDPALEQPPERMWTHACGGRDITCRVRMRKDEQVVAGGVPLGQIQTGQSMRFGYKGPRGGRIIVRAGGEPKICSRTCTLGGFARDSRIKISAAGSRRVKFVGWSDRVRRSTRAIYVGDPTAVQAKFKKKKKRGRR